MNRLFSGRISGRFLSSFSNRLLPTRPVFSCLPDQRFLSSSTRCNKPEVNKEEELADLKGADAFKFILSGLVGCVLIAYLIAVCSQMPLDPERMTIEKQKKMTQEELKDFEKQQSEKSWYAAIYEMCPSGWRWSAGVKIVAENMNLSNWGGLKLGWDYYLSTTEPEWKQALPPPLGEGYPQTKYTITMEILDILFVPQYDPLNGWVFKKRKGAEYFMKKVGFPAAELVYYTEASPMDVQGVLQSFMKKIEKCTPAGENPPQSLYQLYRNSCRYEDGNYKKDLNILGRDPRFVLHLEVNDQAFKLKDAPNVIMVPRPGAVEEGSPDMTLYDLADMLDSIINDNDVCDVRDKLKEIWYDDYGDPTHDYIFQAFRAKEMEQEFRKQEIEKVQQEYLQKHGENTNIPKKRKFGKFL